MEELGRGRGRGRGLVEGNGDNGEVVSGTVRMGRGRGRGLTIAPGVFSDSPVPTQAEPVVGPLRSLERPLPDSDTEDEEDDFISGFRKLTAGPSSLSSSVSSGTSRPSAGEGSCRVASSKGLINEATTVPRGRGRGRGLLAGIVDIPALQNFPHEPEAVLVRQNVSPLSLMSTSPRTNSALSTDETSSENDKSVVIKRGEHGRKVELCVNFVKLRRLAEEDTGLFEYHVFFDPDIEAKRLRHTIIRSCSNHIGTIMNFDGVKLYLPIKLLEQITKVRCIHPTNADIAVNVAIKFVKKSSLDASVQFFNILFRKIMNILGMVEMNRNFFDYEKIYDLPIHKLQIWPGFVTAVDVFEGGLMLCCDSSFRVLRTDTMFDALVRFYDASPDRHVELFRNYALRKVVLTRYNNKHYRIDDVDWQRTPKSTFFQCRNGVQTEISFIEYYKNCHNVTIKDHNQPMLVSRGKIRSQSNEPTPSVILLVPELCYVTGMTEEITSDYRIMKDIAQHTRISPLQRHNAVQEFVQNVNDNPKAQSVLKDWGLDLDSVTVQVEGRVLAPPTIILNRNVQLKQSNVGDFSRDVTKNHIYDPIHVSDWLLVCTPNEEMKARNLMRMYRMVAPPLGINYRGDGNVVYVGGRGRPEDFRRTLVANIKPNVTQFVVVIIPSSRQDLYQVIKIICNREFPVPSQVVLSKTLGDEKRLRSVMQKIALQINCKLGGALWTLKIPLPEKIMFVGMDVYHDPTRKNPSVTGVVATISETYTKYYSRVIFQSAQQESVGSLRPIIIDCMTEFFKENQAYPDRIVLFRDGVGDGQLELAKNTEVAQILESCKWLDAKPKFTFCVVQKRINARMFVQEGSHYLNPEPGTVLDHTVTRRYLFDFFLVSQLIREGTVNPTHYIVLYDDAQIKPDVMQKFAYATSYMYYNWAGSIRVPAMCQYAHKLAGLVGQHLRAEPSPELSNKLYYL